MPVLERLSSDEALARVQRALGDRVSDTKVSFDSIDVTCQPQNLVGVVTALRDDPGLECRYFTFLSAVDRSAVKDQPGGLEVLVHLYAPDRAVHVTVHVPVDAADPRCPSITGIFRGAVWQERETHEMFGIDFEGHPNLSHLYLPEDFEGHPLRKDFKLPSRHIKEWPGAKDPEEAAAGGR